MSSILESISRERELLDYPKESKPQVHQLYGATVRNFQGLYNRLANTNEAWALGETTLTVNSSNGVYTLAEDDSIGKILLITTKAGNPSEQERVIDFYDPQNINFDRGSAATESWFGHYAGGASYGRERMAVFYDTDGRLKVEVKPVPEDSQAYRVKYSLGRWADRLPPTASPILAQFHLIFEIRAAKDVLYMCEWDGFDSKQNFYKRNEIRKSLDEQEARYLVDFERYIKEMTHDRMIVRRAWDDD